MKKIMTSALALMILLCSATTYAWNQQDSCCDPCVTCDPCCSSSGWYIGAFGGANWLTGSKHSHGCFSGKPRYQTGYVLAASIGRNICDFRVEFEYAYRNNDVKHSNVCNVCAPRKAELWSNSYMFNGFWNIPMLCNDWSIKPYVGAGIGYTTQHLRFDHHDNTTPFGNNSRKKNGFAWQVIAGLAYPICDIVDLTLEYRFYQGAFKNLYSQNLGAGLRYNF